MPKYLPPKGPAPAKRAGGRPPCIANVAEIPAEAYDRGPSSIAGVSRDIGAAVGTERIGVDLTEIAPGRKSSYLHHHEHKEEFFYVLSGRCKVQLGEQTWELGPGDAVSRPAGTGHAHQFQNPFAEPCQVLMFGVMAGEGVEDVVDWPELKRKLFIDAAGARKIVKQPKP